VNMMGQRGKGGGWESWGKIKNPSEKNEKNYNNARTREKFLQKMKEKKGGELVNKNIAKGDPICPKQKGIMKNTRRRKGRKRKKNKKKKGLRCLTNIRGATRPSEKVIGEKGIEQPY